MPIERIPSAPTVGRDLQERPSAQRFPVFADKDEVPGSSPGSPRHQPDRRRPADLEAFLGDLLERRAAATVWTRYKVLRILYRWLEEEDEITGNPMAKMRPPIVSEQPVPVVPEDGLRRLLGTCAGKSFEDRRDTALILLLVDVGPHRARADGPHRR